MDIIIINDTILENDETFAVRLSSPDEDVTVESQDATVIISDDDGINIIIVRQLYILAIINPLNLRFLPGNKPIDASNSIRP